MPADPTPTVRRVLYHKTGASKIHWIFCQQRRAQTYDGWLLLAAVGSERTRRQPFAVVEVGLAERTGAVGVADGVRLVDTGRRDHHLVAFDLRVGEVPLAVGEPDLAEQRAGGDDVLYQIWTSAAQFQSHFVDFANFA